MLSYQHAYHAGGPADVHKHALLAGLLAALTVKARPISYLESHAGRGLYDLSSHAARRTGEAARGVALLRSAGEHPYLSALAAIRAQHGADAYPGSPMLAQTLLRPGDMLALMELHPAEYAALATVMPRKTEDAPTVAVHRRDGAEGLKALTPPQPLRGLALIDPSYEMKTEYADTAVMALQVAARWPQGVIAVWYPILPEKRHEALTGPIDAVGAVPDGGIAVLRDEVTFLNRPPRGMTGSGMILINPPHGAAEIVRQAHALCRGVFAPVRRTAAA